MRGRVIALAIGAVGVVIGAWMLSRGLDESSTADETSASSTASKSPAPTSGPAPSLPREPESRAAERVEQARPAANGTLRVVIDAPGRSSGNVEALYIMLKRDDVLRVVPVPANHIVVEEVVTGLYTLRVGSPSALEGEDEQVLVRANEATEHRIHLAPPGKGRLRVTTIDESGATIGNVKLALTGSGITDRLFTFENGVAATVLPPGDYTVSYESASVRVHVVAGTTRDATLRVKPRAIIRGVVVGTDGQPRHAEVIVTSAAFAHARTSSDAHGAFTIAVMMEPPFEVLAEMTDGERSPIVTTDGSSSVRLEIGGGARIEGTVVRENGAPAAEFQVGIRREKGQVAVMDERSYTNGVFSWSGLGPGEYKLTAKIAPYIMRKTVTIAADARSVTATFALPRPLTVRARIVDAISREPIAGVTGRLRRESYTDDVVGMDEPAPLTPGPSGEVSAQVIPGSFQLEIEGTATHLATNRTLTIDKDTADLGEISVARARR